MARRRMSEERVVRGRRSRLGCLVWFAAMAVISVAVVVAIGFIFDQGDSAKQPQRGYDAGAADAYQPATVNYLEFEHLYVVRLQDGSFLALYDKSPKQQEVGGNCRVSFEDNASLGTLEHVPGMAGGFVEDCTSERAVWRADGVFAFGASYGNLDRFNTHVDANGHLIVETDSRTCTRSRGVDAPVR
jgi:hypothetical protein